MKHDWTADVANRPNADYRLVVDIACGDEHRATIMRSEGGELMLRWFGDERDADVPAKWLAEVLSKAEREL
jgi:hypothetical protein